jgi:hypothetical protein
MARQGVPVHPYERRSLEQVRRGIGTSHKACV